MDHRRRPSTIVAAGIAVAALLAGVPPSPDPAFCFLVAFRSDSARFVTEIAGRQFVTLNEACQAQITRLRSLLQRGPWPMGGAFRAQRNDGRCRNGSGFGDAVLSAGGTGK